MPRAGVNNAAWVQERRHRATVAKKHAKLNGLVALIEEWEAIAQARSLNEEEAAYLKDLHKRRRAAQVQLQAMIG